MVLESMAVERRTSVDFSDSRFRILILYVLIIVLFRIKEVAWKRMLLNDKSDAQGDKQGHVCFMH